MLAEAAADLDEKQRQAVEAAIRKAETDPLPGAMDQPPAEYRLTQDAAALLAMTTAESEAVDRTTREMIERYHELERRHVSVSEDHAREVSGSPQSLASFKVTTFPSEGSALRAEWVAQINAALGADRAQYLLQLAASWIQSDLGAFGEAERTITFREGEGSAGFSDKNSHGYSYGLGTGGPAPIPPGWRHLIVRPPEGGLPGLRF